MEEERDQKEIWHFFEVGGGCEAHYRGVISGSDLRTRRDTGINVQVQNNSPKNQLSGINEIILSMNEQDKDKRKYSVK